jgi:hypothetical protein
MAMNDEELNTARALQLNLGAMLEFAQAFGMGKAEASAIFTSFTRALKEAPEAAHSDLLGDLLDKWAPAAEMVRTDRPSRLD